MTYFILQNGTKRNEITRKSTSLRNKKTMLKSLNLSFLKSSSLRMMRNKIPLSFLFHGRTRKGIPYFFFPRNRQNFLLPVWRISYYKTEWNETKRHKKHIFTKYCERTMLKFFLLNLSFLKIFKPRNDSLFRLLRKNVFARNWKP